MRPRNRSYYLPGTYWHSSGSLGLSAEASDHSSAMESGCRISYRCQNRGSCPANYQSRTPHRPRRARRTRPSRSNFGGWRKRIQVMTPPRRSRNRKIAARDDPYRAPVLPGATPPPAKASSLPQRRRRQTTGYRSKLSTADICAVSYTHLTLPTIE